MSSADDRLRAATAAGEERVRLLQLRAQLVEQVHAMDARILPLAAQLGKELADVERISGGMAGQYRRAFAMPGLAKEQQEAFEANNRYQTALGERTLLVNQIENIDGRLLALTPDVIARELQSARAEKRAEIVAAGGERAAALSDLEISLESIDIELMPLADAIAAGATTIARFGELVRLLRDADNDRTWRKQADAAADAAQRQLDAFCTAIADLAPAGDPLAVPEPPAPLADDWVKQAYDGRGDIAAKSGAAITHIGEREAFVRAQLAAIEARHAEIAQRRAAIARAHDDLLIS